ncbi:hypothetical protein DR64_2754 [Paraburkholderia xenovorans LB400]|jgi:hypothetical protein|uniref:Uncharacterized protein n=1 Tax=Paraburkholderia xenovorans (strain LB400) TaxID=266265 RepID=Q13U87_PARXL|nr:hypothetical protein [Paraburkholderia xenovorans]ABE32352.1 hypothetical protein Bxe_A0581 [Paraburkholderia xenovorans LB400]AIP33510.1 hypothetical protein DR64_2754 [Paraburkholderia xenovorans LB400]
MSKIGKNTKPASRPPVDALQYEKLALSAFGSCERQLTQLNRLATLATSIYRNPALTTHERRSRQVLLELLVETCEEYEREVECDRELYKVIALDARGIAHRRITASVAAKLLAEAGREAKKDKPDVRQSVTATRKSAESKTDTATAANAH